MGGRFDPPHLGHREAVRGLFQYPGAKQVLVIPSGSPPHKPTRVSAQDRAEMARLNFKKTFTDPFPNEVILDLREVERALTQPNRPSYSYDTLQELRQQYPQLAFVIGTDQLEQLHTWYRFPDLLSLCHWIVLERKGNQNQAAQRALQEWSGSGLIQPFQSNLWRIRGSQTVLNLVPTDAPAISSTQIRETLVKTGAPPQDSLLPEVLGYLNEKKLYGM